MYFPHLLSLSSLCHIIQPPLLLYLDYFHEVFIHVPICKESSHAFHLRKCNCRLLHVACGRRQYLLSCIVCQLSLVVHWCLWSLQYIQNILHFLCSQIADLCLWFEIVVDIFTVTFQSGLQCWNELGERTLLLQLFSLRSLHCAANALAVFLTAISVWSRKMSLQSHDRSPFISHWYCGTFSLFQPGAWVSMVISRVNQSVGRYFSSLFNFQVSFFAVFTLNHESRDCGVPSHLLSYLSSFLHALKNSTFIMISSLYFLLLIGLPYLVDVLDCLIILDMTSWFSYKE